jgi:spore germination protein
LSDFWRRRVQDLAPRLRSAALAAAVAVAVLVMVVLWRARTLPETMPLARRILGKAPYRPVILGFYENDSSPGAGDGSWQSLARHVRYIDLVAPYWYRVGNGGVIAMDTHDPKVLAFAARHAVRVWPLVGNDGYSMIATPAGRRTTVATLVELARARHYDGLFIDFELIPPSQRDNFSTFVHELSLALHRRNLGLGVAVFPKVGVTPDVQGVYDYPALGGLADAVIVMTYDHHQNSSAPGAVAPLNWVQSNMVYAVRFIDRLKLFTGVAAYGYDWIRPGDAETVSTRQVQAILTAKGITPVWSKVQQEPHFTYQDAKGRTHSVWYEDSFTFHQKLGLSRSMRLGGMAIWRLGYEEPSFWAQLQREERGLPPKPLPPVTHPHARQTKPVSPRTP